MPDLIVLLTLVLLKNYLIKIGQWHYVRVKGSIYENPSYKCDINDLSQKEREDILEKERAK